MELQLLFGKLAVSDFVADFLHRLPVATSGEATATLNLSLDAVGELLSDSEAEVLTVRQGVCAGANPRSADELRKVLEEGYTVRLRHAERHSRKLNDLAGAFAQTFRGAIDVQVFVTPAGAAGFSWHYDAEDVFIIQTAGSKEYSLRKNTVNPWPIAETIPADMKYERELMPLSRVLLTPGDMAYIPCGYWHKAEARGQQEHSVSVAVGVMSKTALDLLDVLRMHLRDSLLWRQRLPIARDSGSAGDGYYGPEWEHLVDQLAADLSRQLKDPALVKAIF